MEICAFIDLLLLLYCIQFVWNYYNTNKNRSLRRTQCVMHAKQRIISEENHSNAKRDEEG